VLAPAALADDARPPAPAPAPAQAPIRTVSASNVPPPEPKLAPRPRIDVAKLPERCRAIGKRASASIAAQAVPANIALAGCVADDALAKLVLIDSGESIAAIDEAVIPALERLDDVAATADPAHRVMALAAKIQLYTSMITRMQSSVPPPASQTNEALGLRASRMQIVEQLVTPWREQALEQHRAIVELAKAHPDLMRHPVAAVTIRDSRDRIAKQIAMAPATPPRPPEQADDEADAPSDPAPDKDPGASD